MRYEKLLEALSEEYEDQETIENKASFYQEREEIEQIESELIKEGYVL